VREAADIAVRPAGLDDVAEMGRVFVDTFRAAHRGQMPEELLLERTHETSAAGWAETLREVAGTDDPEERVWVAVDSAGAIVGVAMGGPPKPWAADAPARGERPTRECYVLYVDVPAQGRGVGRALLVELAAFLVSRGTHRLLVGVLAANEPARRFYESVGGVLLGERLFDDSDVLLDEVVYVWEDLPSVLVDWLGVGRTQRAGGSDTHA
jgi:ribosomal protein S18 acetylase RimI-like enzyme